jgi:hypothetical protein
MTDYCKKHELKKNVDLGGVMFCKKCLEEGIKRYEEGGFFKKDAKN